MAWVCTLIFTFITTAGCLHCSLDFPGFFIPGSRDELNFDVEMLIDEFL